jgi:hypothetical protein
MPIRERSVWIAVPTVDPPHLCEWATAWRTLGFHVALLFDEGHEVVHAPVADIAVWEPYRGWAAAVNSLASRVFWRGADIMVTGGDDIWPDPHWDAQRLAERFAAEFPDFDGVAQPSGGNVHDTDTCCIAPLIGCGWWARHYRARGPFWPEYFHFWTDSELHDVAARDKRLALWPQVAWRHEHWFLRGTEPTPHLRIARSRNEQDREMYLARKAAAFPGA